MLTFYALFRVHLCPAKSPHPSWAKYFKCDSVESHWHVPKSEQPHNRGSRAAHKGYCSEQTKGHAKRSSRSEQVNARFRIGSEEKIQRAAFHRLAPEDAKAMLKARGLPNSPVVRQLFEWLAELEKRPAEK
jgi:hypothetical protein